MTKTDQGRAVQESPGTGRRIGFWDTTMRDGHQCLWATRMTSEMIEPIASTAGEAGFDIIGIGGAAVFDSTIYYLAENIWDRLAMVDRLTPRTPKACYIRSLNILGWDIFPDDATELTIRTLKKYGVTVMNAFDALNDTRNMESTIRFTLQHDMHSVASLVYSISPVHTDDYYVKKAKELVAMGVHGIQLKDSGGLLTPDRVSQLVPKLRKAIGPKVQLHFHTHCTSGLGTLSALTAMPLGIDIMHGAVSPLANSNSNPPLEILAREAQNMGFDMPLDMNKLTEYSEYFLNVAREHGKPLGGGSIYDPELYRHQLPGGMLSNLKSQMAAQGLDDVPFEKLLDEVRQIREDLGYPIVVSPMAQYIGVQAVFNLVHGERYKIVPAEIRNYALGWYGEHPAPMNPDVYDKIAQGGEPITGRPADHVPPLVERARKEFGQNMSDEELILSFHYKPATMNAWRAMRSDALHYPIADHPTQVFMDELRRRPDITYAHLSRAADEVTFRR
ncbi:pyruvate carboxylase subunit B [Leisingera daeponensis]|uniref:pyruvate carboxylase subunit B n=1 Tax=Leisingera daeponensis TaxID=405746 RepID=UPI001C95E42F|nr:pyruvate carboxylase subunit B [Leisingera daeponensis]MBY6059401.1 pyruvate carboxylase subunit B [Leisingera daeponensis]